MVSEVSGGWAEHYERLDDDEFELFALEARDYCERLARIARLDASQAVLDFGCGFGFVSELLAPRVGKLYLWDQAGNMRERALRRAVARGNVELLDLSHPSPAAVQVDLVIVNSVIQYMTVAQLEEWLSRWRQLLRPAGAILISDVIPPDSAFLREVADSLAFATRHGFLIKSLRKAISALGQYTRARRSNPLLRLTREQLAHMAHGAGLEPQFLPENLTYRQNRVTARLSLAS